MPRGYKNNGEKIIPPNLKGRKRSPEGVARGAAKRKGQKRPTNSGVFNKKWKGDDASYYAIHIWVSNHFGKAYEHPCTFCEKRGNSHQMHWANLDHKYSRDKKDWIVLCAKCHANYDRTVLGVKRGGDVRNFNGLS